MNAKEHNDAVYAEVKRMLNEKVRELLSHETEYFQEKTIGVIIQLYAEPQFQHIVVRHYGYSRPIEETAKVISDRILEESGINVIAH